jgi:hypothetical protein
MDPEDVTEGMRVRLIGPPDHPLHGAAGTVVRVLGPDDLWHHYPATMLGEPFAWTDGSVLVSLDDRPPDRKGHRWTPVVTVRPADVEDASQLHVPPARERLRELLAGFTATGRVFTEGVLRDALEADGFRVNRRTLHRWVTEDQDPARAGTGRAPG